MNSQEPHAHGIIVRAENSRNARMLSGAFPGRANRGRPFTGTRLIKSPAEHLIYATG